MIVALAGQCEIRVGSQSSLSSTTYTDNLTPEPATVTTGLKLTSMHATVTKDSGFCPLAGIGERTNATLTGTSLAKASVEGEAVGIAALPSKKTRLCSGLQAKNVCPDALTYPAGTGVAAVFKPPQFLNPVMIEVGVGKEPNEDVNCEEGTVFMRTHEKEGKPLTVETVALAFAGCKTREKGTACSVNQVSGSVTGELRASRLRPGSGFAVIPLSLRVECGKEINCEYVHPSYAIRLSDIALLWPLEAQTAMGHKPREGDVGCADRARWQGGYMIYEPNPIAVHFSI